MLALSCLVFEIIVMLEGEPSHQSEILRALEQVFLKDVSLYFDSLIFLPLFINFDMPSSPATKKNQWSLVFPSCNSWFSVHCGRIILVLFGKHSAK